MSSFPKIRNPHFGSLYEDVRKAQASNDFGQALAYLNQPTGSLVTQTSLSPALKPAFNYSSSGLGNNLRYLMEAPQARYQAMGLGQDPYYNTLQESTRRGTESAVGRSLVNAQSTGMLNSTTLGGALGQIYNDDVMRQQQNFVNAFQLGNNTARGNVETQLSALGGLSNLVSPLGPMANNNLLTALSAQESFNANERARAEQLRQAEKQKKSEARKKLLFNSLALAAAPFTGGASLGAVRF